MCVLSEMDSTYSRLFQKTFELFNELQIQFNLTFPSDYLLQQNCEFNTVTNTLDVEGLVRCYGTLIDTFSCEISAESELKVVRAHSMILIRAAEAHLLAHLLVIYSQH